MSLTSNERLIAIFALRIAAEQYDHYARVMHSFSEPRLAFDFKKKADDARELADKLETEELHA